MDPHVSVEGATFQVRRVAASRGVAAQRVQEIIDRLAESPDGLGLGDRLVNVLELNLALDRQFGAPSPPPKPATEPAPAP
jgi:K+-transporting ATPase ATPase C chain